MNLENCSVLIHCDKEMRRAVVAQLRQLDNIKEIEELDNERELRVKIVAELKDHLREIVAMKIWKMICVESVENLE